MSLQAFALSSLFVSRAIGGVIAARDDESLFNPETGKPEVQDVIDFVKIGSQDYFDKTFSAVMFAVANEPDHVDNLFVGKPDGSHQFLFFDPVTHERWPYPIILGDAKDYAGGSDLESFKSRWWIAAAYTVLKDEWSASYVPSQDTSTVLQPTDKGRAFDDAIQARYPGFVPTPMRIGDVDIKAAIWLMSALLRRNAVWSTYGADKESKWVRTPETIKEVVDHGPSLWIGYTKPDDANNADGYKAYAMESIEYRERSDVILSRPDAGSKATATIDLAADPGPFHAILMHLEDLAEEWDADNWYNKQDARPLSEPLVQ